MNGVTPPPAPPTTPVWEDLVDIFVSPSAVFARRKDDPQFFAALAMLTGIVAVLTIASWDLLQPIKQADASRGIEMYLRAHPDLPSAQVEAIRNRASGGGSIGRWLGWLSAPLVVLAGGLFVWLAAKAVRAATTLGQSFMVMTYAFAPKVIGLIAGIVMAAVLPETTLNTQFHLTLSPTQFISPDAMLPSRMALLTRFDLTTLWGTALIALGIRVTAGTTMARSALAAFVVWAIASVATFGFVYGFEAIQGLH